MTLFADDLKASAHGPHKFDNLILTLLTWSALGCPFSWPKCRGGMAFEWVGYWVDYGRFQIGISEKRANWIEKWLEEVVKEGKVQVRRMIEALGRLSFAAGVLEWHRPFLSPLYAWTAAVPPKAVVRIPVMIRLALQHLLERFKAGHRMVECRPFSRCKGELFRTDASAHAEYAVLGG